MTWRVAPNSGLETAWVEFEESNLGGKSLSASGRAVGTDPSPYWLEYELETGNDYVTHALDVTVRTIEDTRTLELRHDGPNWSANGNPIPELTGAVDCDLGLCPLTNTMPILRHGLHEGAGRHELLMAWVAVPELTVRPSTQTYTHLEKTSEGARVRYESGDFSSDLLVDRDGLVIDYPQLATRIDG